LVIVDISFKQIFLNKYRLKCNKFLERVVDFVSMAFNCSATLGREPFKGLNLRPLGPLTVNQPFRKFDPGPVIFAVLKSFRRFREEGTESAFNGKRFVVESHEG
jgi:hypothetical protein